MINDLINIAREAGSVIRGGFGKQLNIEFKTSEANLVTNIDKASEKIITDFIKKKYPSHNILAEEGGEIKGSSEYTWVIDPLDGTTNFAHALPIFSVSIGLMKGDEIIAGVVYDVMQDEMYSAEKGSGAFSNGNKINVSDNNIIGRSLLVTGFPYNIKENPEHALERFVTFIKLARGVRRLGSAAIDLCYVAKGVFDGYWEVHLQPWDMAAGILLVSEAGGMVTDFDSNKMQVKGKRILATNGKIHNEMIKILNSGY